jgi:hypothetical protein
MKLHQEQCIGCGICLPYCPVGAIHLADTTARISEELCTECGTCARPGVIPCPGDCFEEQEIHEWSRSIRKHFSDPMPIHAATRVPGRGTEESKTNDVTGRVLPGQIGLGIEMGRPVIGVWGRDIEIMTTRLAAAGVRFESCNPLTYLMEDPLTGVCQDALRQAHLVSAIIEFVIQEAELPKILDAIKQAECAIETVFALYLIMPLGGNPASVLSMLQGFGISPRPNAKVNLGLGQPLFRKEDPL